MIGAIAIGSLALLQAEPVKSTAEGRVDLWGNIALSDPWFLLLVPVAALAMWAGRTSRRYARARVSLVPGTSPGAGAVPLARSWVQRLTWLPTALQAGALVLTIFALSRPLRGNVELSTKSEGVDIALLVDRSSSMDAQERPGAPRRFDIVKDVVEDFATRRMTDREGAADNIALIAFSLYPELMCPFTLDVDALSGVFDDLDTEKRRELDATGIGIALAKAVSILRESTAKSRIAVLLTDGLENVKEIQPLEAAKLAAEEDIRVYTIFAGPRVVRRQSIFGTEEITIDTAELEKIAGIASGKFYHAETQADLEAVYAEIEQLERTERTETRYAEHFDLYPNLLLPAFLMYLLAWLSYSTWARRLP